jgi:hypothetical protein
MMELVEVIDSWLMGSIDGQIAANDLTFGDLIDKNTGAGFCI